jgi:excisionase family DNA binding protein
MNTYPEILTIEQAADMLQVSVRTLQRMVKKKQIPGRQVGSQWRFDREQLRQWVRCEVEVPVEPKPALSQFELIEKESRRMGLDRPETLIELQQAAARRLAEQADDGDDDPDDED